MAPSFECVEALDKGLGCMALVIADFEVVRVFSAEPWWRSCVYETFSLVWLVGVSGSLRSLAVVVLSCSSSTGVWQSIVRESGFFERSEKVKSLLKRVGGSDACEVIEDMLTGGLCAELW